MRFAPALACLVLALALAACAAKRPVLYPNEHLQEAGQVQADADIDRCTELAEQEGASSSSAATETAERTAGGAAVGAATGAVVGAIGGNAGTGAAMGAAGGGTAGLLSGIFSSHEPDPVHKAFVERCLRDRGYEPIGWK
ncbi:MAG TPA: glycine zipper family protein [Myxococcota bacterium]|jgi:uncharacterized protein YcfJ|nr:glycine zipper family protein [Myxococcota bacterium]